jgi:pyruvate/2-oxoglutarate dehydrogenase complex dihydrolipoamide acyltransferase (E2) component
VATPIPIPDLGVNVETIVLLKWLKQEGDPVKRGDILCEVETDKATTELESIAKGVLLKQLFEEGAEIPSGTVIAYVGEQGEAVPE